MENNPEKRPKKSGGITTPKLAKNCQKLPFCTRIVMLSCLTLNLNDLSGFHFTIMLFHFFCVNVFCNIINSDQMSRKIWLCKVTISWKVMSNWAWAQQSEIFLWSQESQIKSDQNWSKLCKKHPENFPKMTKSRSVAPLRL